MKEVMAHFNATVIQALPGIPVSIGQELNWSQLEEYAKIMWPSGTLDDGVMPQQNSMNVDVEVYTKAANVYRIVDLVEMIRAGLPRTKVYSGNRWFEVRNQTANYLELEVGRKAVLTMKIRYWR